MENRSANWQTIIWREWRHCHDLEYGERLFELVADQPIGWGSRLSVILLNALAGAAIGLMGGFVIILNWSVLQQLLWAGLVVGAMHGYLMSRNLCWKDWLQRLESSTPTSDSLGKLAAGTLLIGALSGMIFGPLGWLSLLGIFWAMGGVITWLNKGIENKDKYNAADRRWWIWWPEQPHLLEVEAALEQICAISPEAKQIWQEPLTRLSQRAPTGESPKALVKLLLKGDWGERFLARDHLLRLGEDAQSILTHIADTNASPIQQTAQRLLRDIKNSPQQTPSPRLISPPAETPDF